MTHFYKVNFVRKPGSDLIKKQKSKKLLILNCSNNSISMKPNFGIKLLFSNKEQ